MIKVGIASFVALCMGFGVWIANTAIKMLFDQEYYSLANVGTTIAVSFIASFAACALYEVLHDETD